MAVKNSVNAIERQSVTSPSMQLLVYQPINPAGLDEACFLLRIVNASNQSISVSYDGVTDHDFINTNESVQLNCQTNSQPNNYIAKFKKGTVVYVRGAAGLGGIFLSGYYQANQN